jgi:hypothetical protein
LAGPYRRLMRTVRIIAVGPAVMRANLAAIEAAEDRNPQRAGRQLTR